MSKQIKPAHVQREKKRREKKRRAAKRRKGQKKERKGGRGDDGTDSTEVAAPRGDAGRIARFSDHEQTHITKKDISCKLMLKKFQFTRQNP